MPSKMRNTRGEHEGYMAPHRGLLGFPRAVTLIEAERGQRERASRADKEARRNSREAPDEARFNYYPAASSG